jgi:hypothetical protein
MNTLKKFVAVYVPGTNGLPGTDKSELTHDEQIHYAQETARKLAGKFGGATSQPSVGYYVADNGVLVEENIIIVKSFYDVAADAVEFALSVANWLKTELCQELVSVETESGLQFV